ncbi:hypothetical protein V2J09_021876 [Rumex salicifolius]
MVGPCPCGMFPCHGGYQCCAWPPAPAPSSHLYGASYDDAGDYYSTNDYSSPSVDCTLSLGTPATRRSSGSDTQERRRSNFCGWDFLQTKHSSSSTSSSSRKSSSHRSANSCSNGSSGAGADPLLARRCTNCDTTSTPLWRNGPRGPKSLCNACGIRYKKEERRATAAAAASNVAYLGGGGGGESLDGHVAPTAAGYYNGGWNQYFLHVHDYTH